MFRNQQFHNQQSGNQQSHQHQPRQILSVQHRQQRGSALMIAVFVLLLSGAVLWALLQLTVSSSTGLIYEVQGQRSYQLAKARLEHALVQLYPLNSSAQQCSVLTAPASALYSGDWQGCSSQLQCSEATIDGQRWFYLVSTGSCGEGDLITSRMVEAEITQ